MKGLASLTFFLGEKPFPDDLPSLLPCADMLVASVMVRRRRMFDFILNLGLRRLGRKWSRVTCIELGM